ncbi:hypothetical protein [Dietzia sp. WMMA184]|uniref:hypothetical protein n=1 Tax=Dietzia sp. WMMA184 TaxID=2039808 RepID=UPI0011783649|nr:hypothetical protein [Dietzia sp. WMMA184]
MIDLRRPTFTRKLDLESLRDVEIGHLFYGGEIDEERAFSIASVVSSDPVVAASQVLQLDEAHCRFQSYSRDVSLFESSEIEDFVSGLGGVVAIDLTSLENRVWAPLIRALVATSQPFIGLYAEPDDYNRSEDLPGMVYDLSLSRGIDPLPGFARISRRVNDEGHFVPLLGFEGARLSHIFDQEDVEVSNSFPIVGSPGFRVEYPSITYIANRDILSLDRMDQRVELALASCPFEAFHAIERIHRRISGKHLRIAPIGTKPHALGAVLYAIRNPVTTEIVYDHPIRSSNRTTGTRGVYVFEASSFLQALPNYDGA